jgi:hypothetical protein
VWIAFGLILVIAISTGGTYLLFLFLAILFVVAPSDSSTGCGKPAFSAAPSR